MRMGKMHDQELRTLQSLHNIIAVMKSRRIRYISCILPRSRYSVATVYTKILRYIVRLIHVC
jgi:hypothetical protein